MTGRKTGNPIACLDTTGAMSSVGVGWCQAGLRLDADHVGHPAKGDIPSHSTSMIGRRNRALSLLQRGKQRATDWPLPSNEGVSVDDGQTG